MQNYAIIELEEGALNLVVGIRDITGPRVLRTHRVALQDLGRETLAEALRGIGLEMLQGAAGVHVVLGERRMQHFLATVPKLSVPDAVGYVVREAVRLVSAQSPADVLVSTRLVRRLPHGKLVLGCAAIARSVWEPMREAFAANNLQVLGLYATESCMALAAHASDGGTVAVLECNAGRARFVLCDGQSPVRVRRFQIGGGGAANASSLTTQWVIELPRTFEWLRETKQPLPSTLILGPRVEVDDDALGMLRGDELAVVERARLPVTIDIGQTTPGLAVAVLLAKLCQGRPLPSLLEAPSFTLPMSVASATGLAAALLVGLAGSWCAVIDGTAWLQVRSEQGEVAIEARQLQSELQVDPESGTRSDPDCDAERLATSLSLRRPLSKLIRDVSNCAGSQLHLEDLKFSSTERIVVTGIVQGETRQEALQAIARFSHQLGAIRYVITGGDEEITEVPRLHNCFRFRLGMKWRNS
jgi:hypothetical protein